MVQSRAKSAQAVAVATPCWPAPVSAMTRVLPMRRVSSACPSTLLILCEPVWFRSSRLRKTRAPPACSAKRGTSVRALGRPAWWSVVAPHHPADPGAERGVVLGLVVPAGPLAHGGDQRLRDELAAVGAEV